MTEPRRYVVLTHDHPVLHWDLMFDVGSSLRTWRLEQPPQPNVPVAAAALPDHRPMYLDYQGPVSGGRGTVERWDAGTFTNYHESADRVTAEVRGGHIRGTISLKRIGDGHDWEFVVEAGDGE